MIDGQALPSDSTYRADGGLVLIRNLAHWMTQSVADCDF